jgi:hypothetical protein
MTGNFDGEVVRDRMHRFVIGRLGQQAVCFRGPATAEGEVHGAAAGFAPIRRRAGGFIGSEGALIVAGEALQVRGHGARQGGSPGHHQRLHPGDHFPGHLSADNGGVPRNKRVLLGGGQRT